MKKVIFNFFLLFSLIHEAHAARELLPIVKVVSQRCDGLGKPFKGTGMLIRVDSKTIVLTSEHVVLHSNSGYCHQIFNAEIGTHKAEFDWSTWGEGFATLNVPNLIPKPEWMDLKKLEEIPKEPSRSIMNEVTIQGYPYDLQTPVSVTGVTINKENLLFTSERAVSIEGAHAEFGMSGGPFFDRSTGLFAGMITHIQLDASGKLEVLGIPRYTFRRIVPPKVYARGLVEPTFWQDVPAQLAQNFTLISGIFRFTFICAKKVCEVHLHPQNLDSRGNPFRPGNERWLSQPIYDRIQRGETFPGQTFTDYATWSFEHFMGNFPKDRKAIIRKLKWSQKVIDDNPGMTEEFKGIPDFRSFLWDVMEGLTTPVYET